MIDSMAKQEQPQVIPVPITWLRDYAAMLREVLAYQLEPSAPPEARARAEQIDANIKRRLSDIQVYFDRLSVGSKIN